jgi:hypothetical protein
MYIELLFNMDTQETIYVAYYHSKQHNWTRLILDAHYCDHASLATILMLFLNYLRNLTWIMPSDIASQLNNRVVYLVSSKMYGRRVCFLLMQAFKTAFSKSHNLIYGRSIFT